MKSLSNSKSRPTQNVRDTSKEAYFQIQNIGKHKSEWTYTYYILKKIQPATRQMLAKATKYPINKITEYVRIILQRGLAAELPNKQPCKVTGNKAYYLVINLK